MKNIQNILIFASVFAATGANAQIARPMIEIQDQPVIELKANDQGIAYTGQYDELDNEVVIVPVTLIKNTDGSIHAAPALASPRSSRKFGTAVAFGVEGGTLGTTASAGYIIGHVNPRGGVMGDSIDGVLIEGSVGTWGREIALGWASMDIGSQSFNAIRATVMSSWNSNSDRAMRGTYAGADLSMGLFLMRARLGGAYRLEGEGKSLVFRGGFGFVVGF